jgi:hypothetical protein
MYSTVYSDNSFIALKRMRNSFFYETLDCKEHSVSLKEEVMYFI